MFIYFHQVNFHLGDALVLSFASVGHRADEGNILPATDLGSNLCTAACLVGHLTSLSLHFFFHKRAVELLMELQEDGNGPDRQQLIWYLIISCNYEKHNKENYYWEPPPHPASKDRLSWEIIFEPHSAV